MRTFEWDGRRVRLHSNPDDWTVDELDAVEDGLGCNLSTMRGSRTTAAMIAVSVHRDDPSWSIALGVRGILPIAVMRTVEDTPERGDDDGHQGDDEPPPGKVLSPGNVGASRGGAARPRKVSTDRQPRRSRGPESADG